MTTIDTDMEDAGQSPRPCNWRHHLSGQDWIEYLDILFDQLIKMEERPSLATIATAVDIWLELMALATDLSAHEQALIKVELATYLPPEWATWVDFTLDDSTLGQPQLGAFLRRKAPVH